MAKKHRTKPVSPLLARTFAREARDVLAGAVDTLDLGHTRLAAIAAVNACVRASDALCVRALGSHATGEDHQEAVELLELIPDGKLLARKLRLALQYKSQWSYGVTAIGAAELKRVLRAAEDLVEEAERRA